jgi:hypothetical protein
MKQLFKLSLVVLGVIFLAGCGKQPVSRTQPVTPAQEAQQPTTNQPVATQSTPTAPVATQNYVEIKEFGVKFPIDPTFATYKMFAPDPDSPTDKVAEFYSITGQCSGGIISKLTGTPASRKGEFVPSAETKQFDGFFIVYQDPQAVSCDPKKFGDIQQKIVLAVQNGFKNTVLLTQ